LRTVIDLRALNDVEDVHAVGVVVVDAMTIR
jgi:hypothetical protein